MCHVRFSYLLRHSNLCKCPRTLRKFPQKCQKMTRCWECAVYGSRPLIASKLSSSSPEQPGLDNTRSQPWSDATCPCATTSSTLSCLFEQKERDKAEVSTWRGDTGASCVRPWWTRDIFWAGLFRRGWARCRGDWRPGTINGALLTPGYLLALLWEPWLSHVPRGPTKIAKAKQVRKMNQIGILYQIKKKDPKIGPHVWNLRSREFLFQGVQVHPFKMGTNQRPMD